MAVINSDDFTGTNGAAWSSTPWAFTSGGCDIQSNMGRHISPAVAFTNEQMFLRNPPAGTDYLLTFDVINISSTSMFFRVGFHNNQDWICEHNWAGSVQYSNLISGSATGSTVTAGDTIHYKFRLQGTSIKMRYWLNSATEPSTWLLTTTGPAPTGKNEIKYEPRSGSATAVTMYFDNVVLDDNPDAGAASFVAGKPTVVFQAIRRAATR